MNSRNFNYAFINGLHSMLTAGEHVTTRGQQTLELRACVVRIPNSQERVICVPHRKNNIFASIAETLWVLGGRNDIEYLSRYLPRAKDFSDDGVTWRAGYGKRIRDFKGQDQLMNVIELLRRDKSSRQAVISLWDPETDCLPSKDIPCTNWIHFMIRNGKLDMSIVIRSNDIMWGASAINWFEWSVMHQLVATSTDSEIGMLNYYADSFHLYERHFERAQKIVDSCHEFTDMYASGFISSKLYANHITLDAELDHMFSIENRARSRELAEVKELQSLKDPFLRECAYMLYIYDCYLNENDELMTRYLNAMHVNNPLSDLRLAALEYIVRSKKISSDIIINESEENFLLQFREFKEEKVLQDLREIVDTN